MIQQPRAGRSRGKKQSAHAIGREEEILDAAAQIFHRKGYGATSLQDIANAVGMLKGSLYYYVASKEDLLYRISQAIHDQALQNLRDAEAVAGTPTDRLRALAVGHMEGPSTRRTWISVFYTEYKHLTGPRRNEIRTVRQRYEQFVTDLIRQGQADGSFCPDRDAVVMADAVLTLVNGSHLWITGEEAAAHTQAYADFVIDGLRCHHRHPSSAGMRATRKPVPTTVRSGRSAVKSTAKGTPPTKSTLPRTPKR